MGRDYAVKIEPFGNPAIEKVFYMKVAKEDQIESWKRSRSEMITSKFSNFYMSLNTLALLELKFLGVPPFVGSGTFELGGKNCFLVLNRYGPDLDKLRVERGGTLSPSDVFAIAVNCVNILEYIHDFGYVHGDLKGENLLVRKTAFRFL